MPINNTHKKKKLYILDKLISDYGLSLLSLCEKDQSFVEDITAIHTRGDTQNGVFKLHFLFE